MPQILPDVAIKEYFLAQRYASAWQEINARIQSRQTVNMTYVIVSSGCVILILSAISQNKIQDWSELIVLWPAFIAWSFAFWNRHNEATIGILSSYCRECERIVDRDNTSGVPSFHMDEQCWILEAKKYRKYSDRGLIVAYLFSVFPSVVLLVEKHFKNCDITFIVIHISIIFLILSACYFLHRNEAIRLKLAKAKFVEHGGKWKFKT